MHLRSAAVACAVCIGAMAGGVAGQQPEPGVSLDVILDRAASYVGDFIVEFSNVVAEEKYVQNATAFLASFSPIVPRRGISPGLMSSQIRRRELKSDFLLVKTTEASDWVPFRDVFEVDGIPVRDREERLSKLFLESSRSLMEQAEQIRNEGARYNIGNMKSTMNNPLLALAILQSSYQPRFRFSLGKPDKGASIGVWVVNFKEQSRPTIVSGGGGRDLFAEGRLWIEIATGRVVKTELSTGQPAIHANVTTSFRFDDHFGINVPFEMDEEYVLGNGNRVFGDAKYGRFRRFDVHADDKIQLPEMVDDAAGMALVELPAGRFTMGSSLSEEGRNADETKHDVTISQAFFLGRFEVTQQEWRTVMGTAPSHFAGCGPLCPVENVNFVEIEHFLAKLNANPAAKLRYRLPTEAEWEYACRAGTTTPFATGSNLSTGQANYNGTPRGARVTPGLFPQRPMPVGSFAPNTWGLADMHGNVWEWTADWYGLYSSESLTDPRGPLTGENRVVRGGSWNVDAKSARCAIRSAHAPVDRDFSLGFRVAADLKAQAR